MVDLLMATGTGATVRVLVDSDLYHWSAPSFRRYWFARLGLALMRGRTKVAMAAADPAAQACVQYERFIKSYSGRVTQGRTRTLWDIVKPDIYDMMISEITGLVKMKTPVCRPTAPLCATGPSARAHEVCLLHEPINGTL
eukprot:SAG11_NODE_6362_length_1328_cov_4.543531_2_plen_139_part_01